VSEPCPNLSEGKTFMAENERDDGGLPSDPALRRAAVDAHFDDYKAQLAALMEEPMADERNGAEHPAAAWYRQDLERVEAEVLAVVRANMPRVGYQLVAHALIEVVGSVLGDIVEAQPTARVDLDTRLEQLRLHVATAGTRAQ
jgi:hypothetical protein